MSNIIRKGKTALSLRFSLLCRIVAEIGTEIDHSLSFIARVNFINDEFKRASKELGLFSRAYGAVNEEKGERLLNEYLAKEPLGFFREAAKKYKKNWPQGPRIRRKNW